MLCNEAGKIGVWYAFGFALTGRVLDVLSTYLVSPKLMLEGNPFIRRYGWRLALLTTFFSIFAFASPFLGVVIGTMSCVMAMSNFQLAPMVRYAGGEAAFRKVISDNAAALFSLRRSLRDMITIPLPAFCLGAALLLETGANSNGIFAAVAYGLLTWTASVIFYRTVSLVRVYRRIRTTRETLNKAS